MDFLTNILSLFGEINWLEWSGVIATAILFFDRLSKLTPSNTDNMIVEWLYKIFTILGVRVPELEANAKGEIVEVKAVTTPIQKK